MRAAEAGPQRGSRRKQEMDMLGVRSIPTIAEAAALIRSKRLSPVELTYEMLERISELDQELNAFITVTADQAIDQAQQAEKEILAGHYRGPLHGIPIGLKDVIETRGVRTTAHSKILRDYVPGKDAAVANHLGNAGAVMIGKLACHEFAHGGPSFDLPWPPARNPWSPDRITGGSSSGSGAAVAAGLVLGALGTDTGGSIRNPAGLCGVAGLKPTFGLVSCEGIIPNSPTFDHCGPLAWTAQDCRIILEAVTDPGSPSLLSASQGRFTSRSMHLKGLRVGVVRHFWEEDLPASAEVASSLDAALEALSYHGAHLEDIRLRPLQDFYDVKLVIAEAELYAYHERNLLSRRNEFGADFLGRCLPASLFSASDYIIAQKRLEQIRAEMIPIYENYDVLVTTGIYGPAPKFEAHQILNFWSKPSVTTPFNVTGGPALSVCCGYTVEGMPLSMQIAGKPGADSLVLHVGEAYEAATAWREFRPSNTGRGEQTAATRENDESYGSPPMLQVHRTDFGGATERLCASESYHPVVPGDVAAYIDHIKSRLRDNF